MPAEAYPRFQASDPPVQQVWNGVASFDLSRLIECISGAFLSDSPDAVDVVCLV
jgi:hypothetical protein